MEFIGKLSLVATALSPGLYFLLPFVLLLLFRLRKPAAPKEEAVPPPLRVPITTVEEFRRRLFDNGTNPSDLLEDCTEEVRELLRRTPVRKPEAGAPGERSPKGVTGAEGFKCHIHTPPFQVPPSGVIFVGDVPSGAPWGGSSGGCSGMGGIIGAGGNGGSGGGVDGITMIGGSNLQAMRICTGCQGYKAGRYQDLTPFGTWYCYDCARGRCAKCMAVLEPVRRSETLCLKCSGGGLTGVVRGAALGVALLVYLMSIK